MFLPFKPGMGGSVPGILNTRPDFDRIKHGLYDCGGNRVRQSSAGSD